MSERDLEPRGADLPMLRRSRWIISRRSALLFVALSYVAVVAGAALLFRLLETLQNYDDDRNLQISAIFAVVMAIPFGKALYDVHRGS